MHTTKWEYAYNCARCSTTALNIHTNRPINAQILTFFFTHGLISPPPSLSLSPSFVCRKALNEVQWRVPWWWRRRSKKEELHTSLQQLIKFYHSLFMQTFIAICMCVIFATQYSLRLCQRLLFRCRFAFFVVFCW